MLGFRFLKQAIKGNTVNAALLAEYQDFLSANLGTGFKVVDTYGELFKSNPFLLQSVTDANIEQVVTQLQQAQQLDMGGARFVDLLTMLCSSSSGREEIPMPANQLRILERFVKSHPEMLCEMRAGSFGAADPTPVFRYPVHSEDWINLAEIEERHGTAPCLFKAIPTVALASRC